MIMTDMRAVGRLMHNGKKQDAIKLAENLYFNDNNYDASCYLGCLFINGHKKYKISKDINKGKSWLQKGANDNHANSQFFYGLSFLHNAKQPDEFLKAYLYLEKAKTNGSIYSQELVYRK